MISIDINEVNALIAEGRNEEALRVCSLSDYDLYTGLRIATQATAHGAAEVHEVVMQKLCDKMSANPAKQIFDCSHKRGDRSEYAEVADEHARLCGLMPYQAAELIWESVRNRSIQYPENIALLLSKLPEEALNVLLDMEHRNRSLFATLANNRKAYGDACYKFAIALSRRGDFAAKLNLDVPQEVLNEMAALPALGLELDAMLWVVLRDSPQKGIDAFVERISNKVVIDVERINSTAGDRSSEAKAERLLAVLTACQLFPEKIAIDGAIPESCFNRSFVVAALNKKQDALVAGAIQQETLGKILTDEIRVKDSNTLVRSCIYSDDARLAAMAAAALRDVAADERKTLIRSMLQKSDDGAQIEMIFTRLLKPEEMKPTAEWYHAQLEEACQDIISTRSKYLGRLDGCSLGFFASLGNPFGYGEFEFDFGGPRRSPRFTPKNLPEDFDQRLLLSKSLREKIAYLEFLEVAFKAAIPQCELTAAYQLYNRNIIEKGAPSLEAGASQADGAAGQESPVIGQKGNKVFLLLEGGRICTVNLETGATEITQSVASEGAQQASHNE